MIDVETKLADADNGYVLEDQIGHMLRRAHQRASAIFQEIMTERLTPPQFAALVKIRDFGTVSQNRLGRSVAMDPATGELQGTPVPVADGLRTDPVYQTMEYGVSAAGDLIFRKGPAGGNSDRLFELVWVARSGAVSPAAPGFSFRPGGVGNAGWRLSPDDDRVVFPGVVDGSRPT